MDENNNSQNYSIFFQGSNEPEITPIAGQVVIKQDDNWNDFGFKIRCTYRACSFDGSIDIDGNILIGFMPSQAMPDDKKLSFRKDYVAWPQVVELSQNENLKKQLLYFCLLPDLQSYRKVVEQLGINNAMPFLNSLNDLVLNKTKSKKEWWYKTALDSEVYQLAFMRGSEQFFAFHNADSILQGIQNENYSAISQSLDLNFKLSGFNNSHLVTFRFNNQSIIPKRINILIGKNGLGKSQALQKFCRAALGRKEPKTTSLIDSNSEVSRPMINRIIALVTPGEVNKTFPGEYAKKQRLFYRRVDLNNSSSNTGNLGSLFVQLYRSESLIKEKLRCEIFIEALSKVFVIESLYLKVSSDQMVPIARINQIDGFTESGVRTASKLSKVNEPSIKVNNEYYSLSSGQLTFFRFAVQCCLFIENGTVILLDEPETHLHPNFIGEFVEMLDYLLEQTGSTAIIATHSAYFVREVPREQVHVFKEDEQGGVSITKPRLKTFGADIDSISRFVFDEDIDNRLTDKIYNQVKEMSFEQVDELLGDELSMAALMDLKDRLQPQ
jgi:energy-coupling factor transporter ATP-binding protein EcfA2